MIQGVRQFRDQYWERGEPGRETPAVLTKQLYQLWLLGLLLKLIGSSWDVSWHFKWLRDDLAPPHLINTVGTVIVVGLTLFHTFTGYGADKLTLRLMQAGCGIFLVALPIDVIDHRSVGGAADVMDTLLNLLETRRGACDQDHMRACGRQRHGGFCPDAAACARHERHLAEKRLIHLFHHGVQTTRSLSSSSWSRTSASS